MYICFGQGCILDSKYVLDRGVFWMYLCFGQGCILDNNLVYFGCMYGPPGSEVRVFSNVCCWGVEGLLDLF